MPGTQTVEIDTLIENRRLSGLQYAVIIWMCVFMVLEGYDMQVIGFAAPAILREWHVSKAAFGPVISANVVGYMLGSMLLGTIGDGLGRKRVIIGGALIFALFTLAAAFSSSLDELLALRALAGIGLGGAVPTGIALVAEYTPHKMRATMIALMYVGYTLGASMGGFAAALTIPVYGWPAVFVIGGVAPLPLCLLLLYALPESIRFLALKGGKGAQVAAIANRLRPDMEFSGTTRFVATERRRSGSPVAGLFHDGRAVVTLLLWFSFVASLAGHYFLTGWLPTVLSDSGLTISQANIAGGLFNVGGAVGSLAVGLLLDRAGIKVVVLAFLLATPVVISLGIISGPSLMLLMLVVTVAGGLVLGGQIGLNALSGIVYPTAMRSTGSGWAFGVGRIGSISGPIIGGILITMGLSRPSLFLWASVPLFLCALAMLAMTLRMKGGRAHEVGGSTADDESMVEEARQPAQ